MTQSFSKILVLVILIILAGGGIFAWQYFGVPKEEVTEKQTADWKTYYNEKYGIEFKYPKFWILDDKEVLSANLPNQTKNFIQINVSNGVSGREDELMSPCQPGIASVVYQVGKSRNSQQNFEEFVNFQIENPERGLPPAIKPELISTTVGGHNALKIAKTVDNCSAEFYYVEQSPDEYMTISFIADKNDDELLFNQMLSTFKFTEKDETAWETYRNEKYGFEMKYPKGMKIKELSQNEVADLGILPWLMNIRIIKNDEPDKIWAELAIRDFNKVSDTWCSDLGGTFGDSIEINGQKHQKCLHPEFGVLEISEYSVLVGKKGNIFFDFFCGNISESEVCDQILSTFRFLE